LRLTPSLPRWLYQVTRRIAIDVVRRETRRQSREQVSTELHSMNATTADGNTSNPFLNEAMQRSTRQTALQFFLLRYFENKSCAKSGHLRHNRGCAQKR